MVRMPLRRSDEEALQDDRAARADTRTDPVRADTRTDDPAPVDTRTETRVDERRRRSWRRDRSADFSTKIEAAAEQAAAATRTAAATAAAERARSRRPRTSALATVSLVVAVVAGLAVATGVLAGLGVAIGIVALLLGLGGLAATGRYYVAGRTEAMLALLIAIGAIVIGSLALAGNLTWLDTDTDQVARLRDALPGWLT